MGVLNELEQLSWDTFYFRFQIKGGDDGAPLRYVRDPNDKLCFDRVYSRGAGANGAIEPHFESNGGLSVRGGQILVQRDKSIES